MSVKSSVSMSEQQDAFVRGLVAEGRYSSVSAVVQQGLDLLQKQEDSHEAELEALRAFFRKRAEGPFLTEEESRESVRKMIEEKRKQYGV